MNELIYTDSEYKDWIKSIAIQVRSSQIKAAVHVNSDMLQLYWNIGKDITQMQINSKWGDGLIKNVSKDLIHEFPDMKGFSVRNLQSICKWYRFYNKVDEKTKQLVSQTSDSFFMIPWGHHLQIMSKCDCVDKALFFIQKTVQYNWSRAVLLNFLDTKLYEREGRAITNFTKTLPIVDSDLASQVLKDPYCFDFLSMREQYNERELEDALTHNVTQFLLELGKGFAYVGRQVPLEVGDSTFYADLLFYHLDLRCFIVVELKTVPFDPGFLGQLNFYVNTVNHLMCKPVDAPTIGLLICKTKDNAIAQYALEGYNQPLGISEYALEKLLPNEIKSSLPTIEEIENELKNT